MVLQWQPVPKPLVIRPDSVPTAMAADSTAAVLESIILQPNNFALDFYKSHESELIEVDNAQRRRPDRQLRRTVRHHQTNVDRPRAAA